MLCFNCKIVNYKIFHFACLLFILGILPSCGGKDAKKTPTVAPISVKVLVVGEHTSVARHTYVGTIEESRRVPLSVETGGQVLEVACRMGDRVQKGEVLLRVDSASAIDAREAARATLRQAEDGYRRVTEVHGAGGVTEQQLIEVETKLAQARSMASVAERRVANCVLRSPSDGVVGEVHVAEGQMLSPMTPAMTLYIVDRLYVTFSVPESEVSELRVGDNGSMDVPAIDRRYQAKGGAVSRPHQDGKLCDTMVRPGDRTSSEFQLPASIPVRVVEKGMKANALSHAYPVRAEVLRREGLLPGMVSKVCMTGQQSEGLLIPAACVQVTPEGKSVWVVREDSTAERRMVQIGQYVPDGVLVTDGLQTGDRVVTDGFQKLYKGAKIIMN
ncbi:MAG: efflux RND transporter periplasmic adaptor subunit [Paludibacteraceae bacterium]